MLRLLRGAYGLQAVGRVCLQRSRPSHPVASPACSSSSSSSSSRRHSLRGCRPLHSARSAAATANASSSSSSTSCLSLAGCSRASALRQTSLYSAALAAPAPALLQRRRTFRGSAPVQMGRRSAKIATRKGRQDGVKAKLYGRIGKLIVQAVKAGGPDPVANVRLKEVLDKASRADVPKDIVERNLKKAADKSQADFSEVTYEAYGPGGTGFVLECLTDNLNRSASEVRAAVAKAGGKMADSGSVLFNFQRRGLLRVPASAGEEAVLEAAMEAGADDMQPAEGEEGEVEAFKVLTAADEYGTVYKSLREQGLPVIEEESGLVYAPLATLEVDESAFEANEAMLERLLALDDVDTVHTNCAGLAQ